MAHDKHSGGAKEEKAHKRDRRSTLRLSDLHRLAEGAVRTHVEGERQGGERRKKPRGPGHGHSEEK